MSALFLVFAVVVITHQLSPYLVLLGLGLLTAAGMVRPRWVVVGLAGMTAVYLVVHLPYVEQGHDLFSPLGDPFRKFHEEGPAQFEVMTGRRLSGLAAPVLMACLWTLGMIGLLRRLRAGRPTLVLALLFVSPFLIAVLAQGYGGEAVFRIYLFSLPWTALLAGSALEFRSPRRLLPVITVGVVLVASVAMFMSALYGSAELYQVRPGEVRASRYFYDHAAPTSTLTLMAPNFPTGVGDRYDQFGSIGYALPGKLTTTATHVRPRMLGAADLPAISEFVEQQGEASRGDHYLILSTGQQVYGEVMGQLLPGALAGLDTALAQSPDWRVFYRNPDAVIYRFAPDVAGGRAGDLPAELEAGRVRPSRSADRSLDAVALGAGLVGLVALGQVVRRRRRMSARLAGSEVVAPAADLEDLLRRALLAPASDRQPFRRAIGDLEPERGRFGELIAGIVAAHRPEAIRLLGEAWGPLPSTELRALLDDSSASVRAAALSALDPSSDDVAVLRRLLSEDLSADVRLAAVGALARTSEPEQLGALVLALADPDAGVRAGAVETFPVAGTSRAAAPVLDAAEDHHEAVRAAAYRRLAAAPSWVLWMALGRSSRRQELLGVVEEAAAVDRVAALVLERVSSPDVGDRILALELAGHLGTPELLGEAASALSDAEAAVRRAAVAQLGGHDQALPRLVATLRDDPDPVVRREAALALGDVGAVGTLVAFLGALQDPDAEVRRLATQALLRHPSAGLAHRLAAELGTSNIDSVGEVLRGMGPLGQEVLAAAVVEGPADRAAAATELLRRTEVATRLRTDLGAVDPTVRLRAVEVLGALGGSDALDGLVAALCDCHPVIRARAAGYLGGMAGQRARRAVQRVADSDQAPKVLEVANEALRRMDERAPTVDATGRGG